MLVSTPLVVEASDRIGFMDTSPLPCMTRKTNNQANATNHARVSFFQSASNVRVGSLYQFGDYGSHDVFGIVLEIDRTFHFHYNKMY